MNGRAGACPPPRRRPGSPSRRRMNRLPTAFEETVFSLFLDVSLRNKSRTRSSWISAPFDRCGYMQTPVANKQIALAQSAAAIQRWPTAQRVGQDQPQSTSLSVPFL